MQALNLQHQSLENQKSQDSIPVTETNRVPALDGIRGIAFLTVLFYHSELKIIPGGSFGVDLFFVLSGFLITSILLSEYRRNTVISIGHFYLRRALRLLPALFFMVLSVLIYTKIKEPEKLRFAFSDAWHILMYIHNCFLSAEWDQIVHLHQPMYTHLWSLSVEEQFYIVWPFIVIGLLRMPRLVVIAFFIIGIVVPACLRVLLWQDIQHSMWIYARTDLRFDNLLYGALLAWLMHWSVFPNEILRKYLSWAGALSFFSYFLLCRYDLITNGYAFKGGFSVMAFICTLLIAAALWSPLKSIRWLLESRVLRWVGKISYGLYLWHIPVILFLANVENFWLKFVLEMVGVFGIASFSYYAIEVHFLSLKHKISHRRYAKNKINVSLVIS